jgi:glycosyltransferase involved in cell wall biosynthesis
VGTDLPAISVVIAVRNGAASIQQSLESVFDQSYGATELVVMDGASTDGTQAILKRNAARLAYWESEPDRGVYHAWNKALEHVSGDWICFLGADDRFSGPDVLLRAAAVLTRVDPSIRVAYGTINVVDVAGAIISTMGSPWASARKQFTQGMSIPNPATFYRRVLFTELGRFDESFSIAGDYEFLLRELPDREAYFLDGLVAVEMGSGGVSDRPDRRVLRMREAERARRMHGLARGPVALAPAVIRARAREVIRRAFGPGAEATAHSLYRKLRRGVTR